MSYDGDFSLLISQRPNQTVHGPVIVLSTTPPCCVESRKTLSYQRADERTCPLLTVIASRTTSGVAIQGGQHKSIRPWMASSAAPPRHDGGRKTLAYQRADERICPLLTVIASRTTSGVAIQGGQHKSIRPWMASSAAPPRHDGGRKTSVYVIGLLVSGLSSRILRRRDPESPVFFHVFHGVVRGFRITGHFPRLISIRSSWRNRS